MPLLPPKVNGPVSVLTTVVSVSGALQGASVQLLRNGIPVGNPDTADHLGVARPTVAGLGLQPNDQLTATQSHSGETSPPSQFPEPVVGVPAKLPPPIYLSQIHGCADVVILGGTLTGATVRITHSGQEIGFAAAEGTQVSVPIFPNQALPTGAVLLARQEMVWSGAMRSSPETPSLPVVAPPNREQVLVPPQIVPPLYECDAHVLVSGIRDGALLSLESDQGQGNQYLFYGSDVYFSVSPLKLGEKVTVKQWFRTCQMESLPSAGVKAQELTLLLPPRILPTICPGAKQITVVDLKAGATLSLYAGRNGVGVLIGQATAASTTQVFDLPPSLPALPGGPAQYLHALQTRCRARNNTSLSTPIESLPSVPDAPFLPAMIECGRVIEVTNLRQGATLRITSDDAAWPVLSPPIPATGYRAPVLLYRPLRAGEMVTATVTGCGAGPGAVASRRVDPLMSLEPPRIHEPVRAWMHQVKVIDCMPGAQVHVFVNGGWRARGEALSTVVDILVGDLKVEDRISAIQCLCTKISGSRDAVSVKLGEMRVNVKPNPVVRGPQSQSVQVLVEDADDGHQVAGAVHLPGGSTFPTNTPFNWIFPPGQAAPVTKVVAADYNSANVTWSLVDPPPTPPPTAVLTLHLLADQPAVINGVSWGVYKAEVPPNPPSHVTSPGGAAAQVSLPKPQQGQVVYYITCNVDFEYAGESKSASFVKHDVSNQPGMAMIGWSGNPLTGKFALTGVYVPNEDEGYDLVFWIYFWGVV